MQGTETDDTLIGREKVAAMYDIDEKTAERWAARGRIPRPVVKERKFTRWSRNEVQKHVESLIRGESKEAAA